MGHLYFVRHGETVWNVENKICGATDIALTERGHEQAIATGEELVRQGVHIDKILHISEITGVPRQAEPRLTEQCFGKWESTPRDGADFREAKKQFVERHEGGESMLHLAQRIYNLLDDVGADADTVYLLVAHNSIARVVHSYFYEMTNEEYAGFGIKNCEIRRYDF